MSYKYINVQRKVLNKTLWPDTDHDTSISSSVQIFRGIAGKITSKMQHFIKGNRTSLPSSVHPQTALLCLTSTIWHVEYIPSWLGEVRSAEYIRAHRNFCEWVGLDADSVYREILAGDTLTYLMNVTGRGIYADTKTVGYMQSIFNSGITCMDENTYLINKLRAPLWSNLGSPNQDFSRLV